jgi:hypothetical protein
MSADQIAQATAIDEMPGLRWIERVSCAQFGERHVRHQSANICQV